MHSTSNVVCLRQACYLMQDMGSRATAANRSRALLQKLQQKYVKQPPEVEQHVSMANSQTAADQQQRDTTKNLREALARHNHVRSASANALELGVDVNTHHVTRPVTQDQRPVRSRAEGGRKRRK